MIGIRTAGARALVVGVAVAAIGSGGATAATSTWIDVHARLSPVAGTKEAGKFSGMLIKVSRRGITPGHPLVIPSGSRWQLAWSLSLPRLDQPMTATLRVGSARTSRVLCTRCSTKGRGTTLLTARQARSISKGDAVVVVRTRSATLRGHVKVSVAKG